MEQQQAPHVALLPAPAMGHIIPFIELAKQLVNRHGFHVTCIVPTVGHPPTAMKEALQALPPTIRHVFLPPPSLEDLPHGTKLFTIASVALLRSLPSLRDTLEALQKNTRLVAFVINPSATEAIGVANELNIPSYVFCMTGATGLSFCFYMQKLNDKALQPVPIPEVVQMPGCVAFNKRDIFDNVKDPTDDAYKWFLNMSRGLNLAQGILVNSFIDLEPEPIQALQEIGKPIVYPIGPLIRSGSIGQGEVKTSSNMTNQVNRPECLRWLDEQPRRSVLFVCFGSGGTLSHSQMSELALGLEMSGQRFLWVVRSPNSESADAAFFTVQSQNDPFDFLPKGFIERTKERGLLVPSWAPQDEVLSHESTGGFLSHCGWNSTLESVINGVPIIAWPLFAEQHMNAVLLSEGIKVALRPKVNENGIKEKEVVAEVVKELMEGEEGRRINERMKELKEAGVKVLGDNGSSTNALSEVALKWKNHMVN